MWEYLNADGYYFIWKRSDGRLAFVSPMDDAESVCSNVDRLYPAAK